MGEGIEAAKAELRGRMRARLRAMGKEERGERSRRIRDALESSPEWLGAATVALFAPMGTEPDLETLWGESGKRLCLPRVSGVGLAFHAVADLANVALRGRIREPDAAMHPAVGAEELELVVVPGLAFTRHGERLGRGGGYYDRFLAGLPAGIPTIGVAFAFQIADAVPVEAHDARVGRVIWG